MKKLVRNLTGSFVALLLLAGMFSCSNGDDLDTDDPFVEANIINPANKGGGATGGQPQNSAENTVWEGEVALDWSKGDNNGDLINADKFTGKAFVGLKFTISAHEESTAVKIMSQGNWSDIPFESADEDCKIADLGDDVGKMLWIWGNTAIVKFNTGTLSEIKEKGIKFYGTGVTITKVELVSE